MALVNVANMCFEGVLVEKNVNYAEQFGMAAAKKGCSKAHAVLADIYLLDFKADPAPDGATQTKFLDHWRFAAAAGCRDSMEKIESFQDQFGYISKEEVDIVREEFENAAKLEWTEEREEYRYDGLEAKMKGMMLQKMIKTKLREWEIEREE